ncbi:hypothetical protein HOP50_02g11450 [Chloropicon primus]|uniref:CWH43-like N-terminal domain-containing protein n=1 Tax=Chloropicon primus TaxID=1764295 RepID=A0A5B8MEF4_9CHLO|nr:hypothetical protein A3770_02p11590 [Chloropicon primus]UPQ97850.1 hypothetical protein HOP50_02g11450 [Chloropicon primus]|eukprot:QDZ18641.1 hypothetical protein A3770_02p11590 [Chloropicon primus]
MAIIRWKLSSVWNDPRVALGLVHLLCVCTIVATLTTFFAVGHNVREVCELIKESTLYRSFKVNRDKICLDRLPTISYTGILMPEQSIFAVGLSLAAMGGFRAFYLIGRAQLDCIDRHCALEGKGANEVLATTPPLLSLLARILARLDFCGLCRAPEDQKLTSLCQTTIRVGQMSSFWMLPTACVSMKHSIMIHGLSAFLFFGLACVHVCCTYSIQHNLIAHKIVRSDLFETSRRIKELALRCAGFFFFAGLAVYFSLRFSSYQVYLYTMAGALAQYLTVLWLMVGFSTYYVDLTVLLNGGEKPQEKGQEIDL